VKWFGLGFPLAEREEHTRKKREDTMAIEFRCTQCNNLLRTEDDTAGKQAQCPRCGAISTVPAAIVGSSSSPPPPPGNSPFGGAGGQPPVSADSANPYQSPSASAALSGGTPPPLAPKPGKVMAIAILTLVGGCVAALWALLNLFIAFGVCFTVVFVPYEIVLAVLAITKGIRLLGANAQFESPPRTTAIMQIINIITCDMANLAMGIVVLVFCSDPEVKAYLRGY
jgi:hypothetical protein